jgi:hypothetical protein
MRTEVAAGLGRIEQLVADLSACGWADLSRALKNFSNFIWQPEILERNKKKMDCPKLSLSF